jgi:hypothetical protein
VVVLKRYKALVIKRSLVMNSGSLTGSRKEIENINYFPNRGRFHQ